MGKITEHDGPGRYLIESDRPNTPPYLVDLLAWDTEGQCTCQDWEYRIGKYLRSELPPEKRFCKHVQAARDHFTTDVLRRLVHLESPGVGNSAHTAND